MSKKFNLQLFADIDEVITANQLEASVKESFSGLQEKLGSLGYDVILNHKEKAEFVPSHRLGEVVAQRDAFKTQANELNAQLTAMKEAAKGNEALQAQIQQLMDANTKLMGDLDKSQTNAKIMAMATDAHDPSDILAFINHEAISKNAKGELVGVDKEIARIRTEKPHLFKATTGGADTSGGGAGGSQPTGMNALIRGFRR